MRLIRLIIPLLLFLLLIGRADVGATDWYAAPDATSAGDGSRQNPWPLQVALSQSALIQPGDTIYLRGGSYKGPGFIEHP